MTIFHGESISLDECEKRLWLSNISAALSDPFRSTVYSGPYFNRRNIRGYSFCFRLPQPSGAHRFIMVSRHKSPTRPTTEQIAEELSSPSCMMLDGNYGFYNNRSGTKGEYASVLCDHRWYMISQAGIMEPKHGSCFPGLTMRRYHMSDRRRMLLWG